jgi:nucleotidyltransferase/DNA polymerase involved in DNA repair
MSPANGSLILPCRNRPVIVLSNNDGCAVARSNEAKALGYSNGSTLLSDQETLRAKRSDSVFFEL